MSTTYVQKLRLFNRNVWLYIATCALMGFGYQGIYLVLGNLYLLRLDYGPEFVGLVNGLGLFSLAACSLPAGALGKRWGSRRMMIAGMALMTIGFCLVPMAELIPGGWRGAWLVIVWCLVSFSAPLFTVNGSPFLTAATTTEERDHAFSVEAAAWPLAAVAGSLVGGALPGLFSALLTVPLDQPASYRYPLLLVGVSFLIGLLMTLATRELSSEQEHESVSEPDGSRTDPSRAAALPLALLGVMGMVVALGATGQWAATTFFNVYMDAGLHAPTILTGCLAAGVQLMAGVATLLMPLLVKRWGKERVVAVGIMAVALSLLPWALVPHWVAAGVGYMGAIAAATIVMAAIFVYSQELVSPAWRAVMSGAVWMGLGLGSAAIVIGGGLLITAYGYRSLFLTAAAVTTVGGLLFLGYFRVPRGELAGSGTQGDADDR